MLAFSKPKGRYLQVTRGVKTTEIVEGLAIADYHQEVIANALASFSPARISCQTIKDEVLEAGVATSNMRAEKLARDCRPGVTTCPSGFLARD